MNRTRWTLTLDDTWTIAEAPVTTFAVVYKGRTMSTHASLTAAERAAADLRHACGLASGSRAVCVLAEEGE